MNTKITWLIVGIIIGLIIGGVVGYFCLNKINNPGRGNFAKLGEVQLTDEEKAELTSTFENNQTDIISYCQQNPMNCQYYCRTINPENVMCNQVMNMSRGMYTRR